MKLLVCGGMGFIGSAFIRNHISKNPNDEIINLDNLTTGSNIKNLEGIDKTNYQFIEQDIQNIEIIDKIVSDIDVLVNFAAETHVDRSISNPRQFLETNILGTHSLLEATKKYEKLFLHVSTDEIYGDELAWVIIYMDNERLIRNNDGVLQPGTVFKMRKKLDPCS